MQIRATPQVRNASAILNTGKLPNDKKSLTQPRQILSTKFQSVPASNNEKSNTVRYFLWNRQLNNQIQIMLTARITIIGIDSHQDIPSFSKGSKKKN